MSTIITIDTPTERFVFDIRDVTYIVVDDKNPSLTVHHTGEPKVPAYHVKNPDPTKISGISNATTLETLNMPDIAVSYNIPNIRSVRLQYTNRRIAKFEVYFADYSFELHTSDPKDIHAFDDFYEQLVRSMKKFSELHRP